MVYTHYPSTNLTITQGDNTVKYKVYAPNETLPRSNSGTQDTTGSMQFKVPIGFENNLGEISNSGLTPSGPRIYNNGNVSSNFQFIGLIGTATDVTTGSSAADTAFRNNLPGSANYGHYRFLQTTGSILGNKPLLIEFHLKTGANEHGS